MKDITEVARSLVKAKGLKLQDDKLTEIAIKEGFGVKDFILEYQTCVFIYCVHGI
jgi:hypothetical protein